MLQGITWKRWDLQNDDIFFRRNGGGEAKKGGSKEAMEQNTHFLKRRIIEIVKTYGKNINTHYIDKAVTQYPFLKYHLLMNHHYKAVMSTNTTSIFTKGLVLRIANVSWGQRLSEKWDFKFISLGSFGTDPGEFTAKESYQLTPWNKFPSPCSILRHISGLAHLDQ